MSSDLPDHVTEADLLAAVEESTTVYEVQRALRMTRKATNAVLKERGLRERLETAAGALTHTQ